MFTGAGNYWDAASQNAKLKRERQTMLRRMVEAKAIVQENRQLKATLQLREHEQDDGRRRAHRRLVVQQPAPLRDPLRGRQATASASACRCARPTAWSAGSSTPAHSLRACCSSPTAPTSCPRVCFADGIPVIAQGRGDGTIDVRPLEVGRNPFKRGDIIITSGTGGLYPPLVPIARVVKLDDDGAVALPLADPANISFAIVEPPFEPAAVAAESAPQAEDTP